ncbi:LuxR family transcriptional regulator [Salmonella enterica subsp. diarizonae]|nr:LuxR family transcriptional regulator [Salmonella enterica subsp. diarizonae]EEJ4374566.1 helix-turn-helix transcriptional regulator [Salmonella enterica subsp. diarizonae]EGE5261747.1 helix-turn-helix transcriptional regulator [Salmonella enterica subsp. diarizonae serovar 38:k:z]
MTGSASSVLKTDTRLLSENLFLNYGLESIFKDAAIIVGNVNYIIFDIDDYYTVQKYITSAFKTVLIGIVTHNEYNFIDEHHTIYRIKIDASISEWRELLIQASSGQFFSRPEKVRLTANEKNVLAMLVKGMDIRQISRELNVHLKTIYSVRYHVLAKLGCRTVLDYQILSVSKAFTHWITISNVSNLISHVNSKAIA